MGPPQVRARASVEVRVARVGTAATEAAQQAGDELGREPPLREETGLARAAGRVGRRRTELALPDGLRTFHLGFLQGLAGCIVELEAMLGEFLADAQAA